MKSNRNKRNMILWVGAVVLLLAVSIVLHFITASDGFPVKINEVMAGNTQHPNEDGRCCDYIELYNSADHAIDLSGFQLGDIAGSARYRFPDGTVIAADGYVVVYCDKLVDDPTYAPFGISRSGGEMFYLIGANDAIVDSVQTLALDQDEVMRKIDGQWQTSMVATPGYSNTFADGQMRDIYNADVSGIRISEIAACGSAYSASGGVACDWIELHNTGAQTLDLSGFVLSDNVGNDKYVFAQGTQLEADGYLVVLCSAEVFDENLAPFGLSQFGGETVVLKNNLGMIIEIIDTVSLQAGQSMALQQEQWEVTDLPSPGFENTRQGHDACLQQIGAQEGTIQISEITAAEQYHLADHFGAFPDWIELHNTSEQSVDLSGWYLSDEPQNPQKWMIPALQLAPDERAIIFCSGRGTQTGEELHADFSLAAGGEQVTLTSFLGNVVDQVSFGASEPGTSWTFSQQAEATQYPTPGYSNDQDGYERFSAARQPRGAIAIWEVMTSNETYLPQALGECYDWVELRNMTQEALLLSDYCLSDDPNTPDLYPLPQKTLQPGSSIVIILSGDVDLSGMYDHAPFSLDAKQDKLLLYKAGGELIDYVSLCDIPVGQSYGRVEGKGGFAYMAPTPNAANGDGFRMISSAPVSSVESGVYTHETKYEVPFTAEGTIYYTLDGSDPDAGSNVYQEPIVIDKTTVLRAVSIEEGKQKSDIYTATFVIGAEHDLPVVSLVTDPDNLWGYSGIYKNGDMTIKEQKRDAHVSYLGDDGSFALNCELSLHGATTVTAFNKKSFSVRFQDAYDGPLHYDVFEDGEVTSFRSLIIRTAHESTFSSQMRDTLMAHIASNNCDTLLSQKYKYVALYLNGEYWGLYAFRELHSEAHYASYMNVPAESVQIVRFCSDEQNSLNELYSRCANKTYLMDEENFAYASSILDMSSIIDWIIMEAYVSNFDIHGNMRYYYSEEDQLWRCGLVDVDLGMFSVTAFDETAKAFHHGQLVDALLQNETFQQMMAQRLAQLLAGPMSDENMCKTIDEIAAIIRSETPREGQRWGCTPEMWERLVVELKDYCTGRSDTMIDSLCSWVGFTPEEKQAYFGDLI